MSVMAAIGLFVAASVPQDAAPVPAVPTEAAGAVPGAPPPEIPPAQCCLLPALTPVKLELGATMNSKLSKIGEHFPFRLTATIDLGPVAIPAGTTGSGDVVHAAKSGFGGKPGELILAVRHLDYQGVKIPLRSLTYGAGRGNDHSDTAAAFAIAGGVAGSVIAMFITGGEVNIPAGTILYAKTSAAVVLTPALALPPTLQPEESPKP